jgi:hypothetical protein
MSTSALCRGRIQRENPANIHAKEKIVTIDFSTQKILVEGVGSLSTSKTVLFSQIHDVNFADFDPRNSK